MSDQRVEIPGSAPKHELSAHWLSEADPNQQVDVTIILRRAGSSADLEQQLMSGQHRPIARDKAEQALGADKQTLDAVRAFAEANGLTIVSENPASRTVMVRGSTEQMAQAFGARLGSWQDANGTKYLSYEGPLTVPASLAGAVTAVLGLDQRPVAKHH